MDLSLPLRIAVLTLFRDDLTVEVIFFGEGEGTGNVTVNADATSPSMKGELKAKL